MSREIFQVTSRPTDNFVAPSRPDMSSAQSLSELADGLQALAPGLSKFVEKRNKEKSQAELKAGQQARIKNAMDWQEAIDQGLIDRTDSPWFKKGYNLQAGKAAAQNYSQALSLAYEQSSVRGSKSPEEIEGFVNEFRQGWLEENGSEDTDYMDGLLPSALQAESNLRSQHTAFIRGNLREEHSANMAAEQLSLIRDVFETDGSPEELAAKLQESIDTQIFSGTLSKAEANKITVDNIIAVALENDDPSILEYTKYIKAGKHSLADRPAVVKQLEAVESQIASRRMQQWNFNNSIVERNRKNKKIELQRDVANALIDDPATDLTQFQKRAADLGDLAVLSTFESARGNVNANNARSDHRYRDALRIGILQNAVDSTQLMDALVEGHINATDFKELDALYETKDKADSIVNDNEFKTAQSQLRRSLVGDEFDVLGDQPTAIRFNGIQNEFLDEYQEFLESSEVPPSRAARNRFLKEKVREYQVRFYTEDPSESNLLALVNAGYGLPEGVDFSDMTSEGLSQVDPKHYSPSENRLFRDMNELRDALNEYNEAAEISPNAARKTKLGQLFVAFDMPIEEILKAQQKILQQGN